MAKDVFEKISSIEHIPLSRLIEETANDTGKSVTESSIFTKQLIGNIINTLQKGMR